MRSADRSRFAGAARPRPTRRTRMPINGLCVPNDNASTGAQRAPERVCTAAQLASALRHRRRQVSAEYTVDADAWCPSSTRSLRGSLSICGAPAEAAGCRDTAECNPTDCTPPNYGTESAYSCLDIDGSKQLRCVELCIKDSDCRSGRSCVLYDKAPMFHRRPDQRERSSELLRRRRTDHENQRQPDPRLRAGSAGGVPDRRGR